MRNSECSSSDSDSESESNFRRGRKRTLVFSSSPESSSSIGPRRLVTRRKRPRGLEEVFASSDESTPSSSASELSAAQNISESSDSVEFPQNPADSDSDSEEFLVRRLPSWRRRAAVMTDSLDTSDDSDVVAAPSTRRRTTRATVVLETVSISLL